MWPPASMTPASPKISSTPKNAVAAAAMVLRVRSATEAISVANDSALSSAMRRAMAGRRAAGGETFLARIDGGFDARRQQRAEHRRHIGDAFGVAQHEVATAAG